MSEAAGMIVNAFAAKLTQHVLISLSTEMEESEEQGVAVPFAAWNEEAAKSTPAEYNNIMMKKG